MLCLEQLRMQLAQFGLNPADWRIEFNGRRDGLARLKIHPRGDNWFCFEGLVECGDWVALRLCSF